MFGELDRPAQFLKGVGPRRAEQLARLGLLTARDVLYHVPRRYEDASTVQQIGTLEPGSQATVIGRVVTKGVLPTRKGLRIFQAVIRDRSGLIECSWPGQPFLDRIIKKGDLLLVSGAVRFFHGRQLQPREYEILAREGESAGVRSGAVFPIYPATEGLSQRQVRKLLSDNLDDLVEAAAADEVLDPRIRAQVQVPALPEALESLHRPATLAAAESGRRRLAFEELFFLQLLHALVYHEQSVQRPGIVFERLETLVRPFFRSLPFKLTAAQRRVLGEIGADMGSRRRMNRLLQGDVGSGKTVVALFALLRAIENGFQAALMAPTEILADQHQRTVRSMVGDLPVSVQLLTGRMTSAERRDAIARIGSGAAQLVIGTHALIQDDVVFERLGLVVVDEQHRFGVRQRLALADRGQAPDVLVMSATPIPRSLALTLYGDLDLSVLDERPSGRQAIVTRLHPVSGRQAVYDFIRAQVGEGRQAYLVYPLVEESEVLALKSAREEYQRLRAETFPDLRIALLHGQMAAEEKDHVMTTFARGDVDILVATSVIEVGIDVPNATLMVIEHPERFGLSQLHQLRGRVGRGTHQSYCILLVGSREGADRLRVLAQTDDGFRIAEADLHQRGQGDLFGERQSGLPAFRFADLEQDLDLLTAARTAARQIVDADPRLAEHPELRESLQKRYGDRVRMFRTG